MKKIECYIQPYNLDAVAEALAVEAWWACWSPRS